MTSPWPTSNRRGRWSNRNSRKAISAASPRLPECRRRARPCASLAESSTSFAARRSAIGWGGTVRTLPNRSATGGVPPCSARGVVGLLTRERLQAWAECREAASLGEHRWSSPALTPCAPARRRIPASRRRQRDRPARASGSAIVHKRRVLGAKTERVKLGPGRPSTRAHSGPPRSQLWSVADPLAGVRLTG